MKPNSAVMIVVMRQRYRQCHPRGPAEFAARPLAEVVQPGDLTHSVQVADPDERHADDQTDHRHADHLVECRAAAFGALCRVVQRLLCHLPVIPIRPRVEPPFLPAGNVARHPQGETRGTG
jgi:hypothetical protein